MDKQKIFVVDDKDMIGKIIMACLGRDYDCRYFDSPKPVLEQMEAGDLPDLIISDIRMPDMRGDEFLHAVKSDERFRHIRMVMLSSEDSTSERIPNRVQIVRVNSVPRRDTRCFSAIVGCRSLPSIRLPFRKISSYSDEIC